MTERSIADWFTRLNSILIERVDYLFGILNFELTGTYYIMSNIPHVRNINERVLVLKELIEVVEQYHISFNPFNDGREDKIVNGLIEKVNILPCTYIQLLTVKEYVSLQYYSSVEDTKEHAIKMIKGYIEKVESANTEIMEEFLL